jgi:outer membrane immunogenic protein
MLKNLLSVVALSVFPFAAGAADLTVKAPPYIADSWSGFYIGGSVGVARHEATWNEIDNGFGCVTDGCSGTFTQNKSGVVLGVYGGYNFQIRSFVFGVEADGSWLDTDVSNNWRPGRNHAAIQNSTIDGIGTVRGRLGVAVDNAMMYVTAGVAFANVKDSLSLTAPVATIGSNCNGAVANTNDCGNWRTGWVAGGGVEYMFGHHWTARAEVLYIDLGNVTANGTWRGQQIENFSDTVVLARGGLAYKFN